MPPESGESADQKAVPPPITKASRRSVFMAGDEVDAQRAMNQVRDFMNGVSARSARRRAARSRFLVGLGGGSPLDCGGLGLRGITASDQ